MCWQANAVTAAKLGTDEASGLAKAWVNFNGTGAVAIRASYNVSSITDNGTGDYTVNFTTALADADYAATFGTVRNDAAVRGGNFVCLHRDQAGGGTLPASGSLRITTQRPPLQHLTLQMLICQSFTSPSSANPS
jgi:hypothetical protein